MWELLRLLFVSQTAYIRFWQIFKTDILQTKETTSIYANSLAQYVYVTLASINTV